ncbi:MAG TPA: hypothetical protein VI893_08935 [Thermoplasmata archaeon]|nr:hypothetical protein [Thermoplasmata archaeon]
MTAWIGNILMGFVWTVGTIYPWRGYLEIWLMPVAAVLLGFSQVLFANGLRGLDVNLGVRRSRLASTMLTISAVVAAGTFFFAAAEPWRPEYLWRTHDIAAWIQAPMLGTSFLLAAAAFAHAHHQGVVIRRSLTVAILLGVGGVLLLTVFGLLMVGWIVVSIGQFAAVRVFKELQVWAERTKDSGHPGTVPG